MKRLFDDITDMKELRMRYLTALARAGEAKTTDQYMDAEMEIGRQRDQAERRILASQKKQYGQ